MIIIRVIVFWGVGEGEHFFTVSVKEILLISIHVEMNLNVARIATNLIEYNLLI